MSMFLHISVVQISRFSVASGIPVMMRGVFL